MHHHAQREDVEDLLEVERLAAHLLDDAVDVLRPPLHRGLDAFGLQFVLQLRAQLLDVAFALDALLVEQPRDQLVGFGLEKAEREVFDLPLHLPDAQPVRERRKHLQRLARHAFGRGLLAGRRMPQRLQARGQPQHDHAQVTRKREQHLAHVLGLRAGAFGVVPLRGGARLLLHAHELGGLDRERCEVVAENLGDHFLRAVQVLARIHEVARGLHRLGAAHLRDDGGHRIGVRQRVLAGVEFFVGDQRLGERAGARQHVLHDRRAVGRGGRQRVIDHDAVGQGCRLKVRRLSLHDALNRTGNS
ncbi:hypothetical protein D9M68_589800 [compost metagenome]